MTVDEYERLSPEEKEHYFQCPKCAQLVDKRELRDVIFHVKDHKRKPQIPRIRAKRLPNVFIGAIGVLLECALA
jgi:hypothetical protein